MADDQRRAPTEEELEAMKALVREGMELGAVGLSTGLMYEPGMFSDTDEVVALAREVAPYGGIYDSHVRDPAREWLASNREAITIGERAGVPAKLGHLTLIANKHRYESYVWTRQSSRFHRSSTRAGITTSGIEKRCLFNGSPALGADIGAFMRRLICD